MHNTMSKQMQKLNLMNLTAALAVALSMALPAAAEDAVGPILFTNVNVFDGVNKALIKNANVVVTGNKITSVSTEPLAVAGGRVIDGKGRTLMPGLTDCHWHNMAAYMGADVFSAGLGKLNLDFQPIKVRGRIGAGHTTNQCNCTNDTIPDDQRP